MAESKRIECRFDPKDYALLDAVRGSKKFATYIRDAAIEKAKDDRYKITVREAAINGESN